MTKHNMRAKVLVLFLLILATPSLLDARLVEAWTYQELFDKADLVSSAQ